MNCESRPSLEVGILADTHLPHRMKQLPPALFDALAGVDLILHAGDVDRPRALAPLRSVAPVHAVRGNIHLLDLSSGGASLPPLVELQLAGRLVLVTHGYLPGLAGLWFKARDVILRALDADEKAVFNRMIARRLTALYPRADVIVFGHTHRAYIERRRDTLLINPGAVCPTLRERPSVARMTLGSAEPRVEIVPVSTARGRPDQKGCQGSAGCCPER